MFHVKRHCSLRCFKAIVQSELLHTQTVNALCNSENTNLKICHKAFSKLKFKPSHLAVSSNCMYDAYCHKKACLNSTGAKSQTISISHIIYLKCGRN